MRRGMLRRCNDARMKRWAVVGLVIVIVVAVAAYWMRSSRYANSAQAAAARYEQGEVAVSGGRLRMLSQEAVRRQGDRVIYRIRWSRAGAPFDQLVVFKHVSHLGGLVSGWAKLESGSAPGHPRS
jgi:hypothetical protein